MKKVLRFVALSLILVLGIGALASCGAKKVPAGSYEAELSILGQGTKVTYTFSGNKVEAVQKTTVLGMVNTETAEGTYEITENDDGTMQIAFDFEDNDVFEDKTYSYAEGEDYIKIAGVEYQKVEK